MKDILKIVKSLEGSEILLKGVSETIENEAKEQEGGFVSMLLGTLGASLLGNMLAGKGVVRAGEGTARIGYRSKRSSFKIFFDSTAPFMKLSNTKMNLNYQKKSKFNGVYCRDNLLDKIKDRHM